MILILESLEQAYIALPIQIVDILRTFPTGAVPECLAFSKASLLFFGASGVSIVVLLHGF